MARVSADNRLLSADPPVWRLHMLAGGTIDGIIAIPGLAALSLLTLRTRMRIEKPVRAADEENDVELWVEAAPFDDVAELTITGWREINPPSTGFQLVNEVGRTADTVDTILIDPMLRIIGQPSTLPKNSVGKHLGSIFILNGDDQGGIPLVEALTEQRVIEAEEVGVVGQTQRYTLDMMPRYDTKGKYIGHSGSLTLIKPTAVEKEVDQESVIPMGRQFASVLKQPLSRIVANADTIGSRMHGPLRDNYAEYAQDIANAARHLSELVNDMEDLEAIDRPDFSVARDRIELGDIARRVAGLLALKASDHGIRLNLPPEDETIEAFGEFRRVLQILLNLVGNAIRYAPDGSTVSITTNKQGDFATISVSDEGDGVADEDRERVFEKFERLGRSGDGGSGLGLYISRRLALAMNGELVVDSAPTGGALFRLTLPAR
jgi:Histidine kinase-, DNA gyrase B-, and HSP90-like ATPase/His Kinase A (phospho-acceptor) domain